MHDFLLIPHDKVVFDNMINTQPKNVFLHLKDLHRGKIFDVLDYLTKIFPTTFFLTISGFESRCCSDSSFLVYMNIEYLIFVDTEPCNSLLTSNNICLFLSSTYYNSLLLSNNLFSSFTDSCRDVFLFYPLYFSSVIIETLNTMCASFRFKSLTKLDIYSQDKLPHDSLIISFSINQKIKKYLSATYFYVDILFVDLETSSTNLLKSASARFPLRITSSKEGINGVCFILASSNLFKLNLSILLKVFTATHFINVYFISLSTIIDQRMLNFNNITTFIFFGCVDKLHLINSTNNLSYPLITPVQFYASLINDSNYLFIKESELFNILKEKASVDITALTYLTTRNDYEKSLSVVSNASFNEGNPFENLLNLEIDNGYSGTATKYSKEITDY